MAKQQTKQKVKLRPTLTAQNNLTLYLDWSKENKRKSDPHYQVYSSGWGTQKESRELYTYTQFLMLPQIVIL